MFKKIKKAFEEPIGLMALFVSVMVPIFQSDWFSSLLEGNIHVIAYYYEQESGQCSLAALKIDNKSNLTYGDIAFYIVEDWITKNGHESINFGRRIEMMITENMSTPIPFREDLSVEYISSQGTIRVPKLSPGQYLDLFFARGMSSDMNTARNKLGEDPRYWNTPRIEYAASDRGRLRIQSEGDCLSKM